MFTLIRGATVLAPKPLGVRDILLCGETIAAIGERLEVGVLAERCRVLDADALTAVPGYIDGHVHIIGGGGEAGFASRTPEVVLGSVVSSGVTTVVGVLGTDGVTRHLESLLSKAGALEAEGLSAYIYTGSYEVPPLTFTGSVHRDMAVVDKVIGCGEIAVSDHRSSFPTVEELGRIAAQCRIGGMLTGKAGVLHLHMGDGKEGLGPIRELLARSDIPIRHFYPTHVNRNPDLLEEAVRFAHEGGTIDVTSGISPAVGVARALYASQAVAHCVRRGVPLERITMSSDGNGAMAFLDDAGKPTGLLVARLDSLHAELTALVKREGFDLADAVRIVTSNVADYLRLPRKGYIAEGGSADLVLLDERLEIVDVFSRGRRMAAGGETIVRGTFEERERKS